MHHHIWVCSFKADREGLTGRLHFSNGLVGVGRSIQMPGGMRPGRCEDQGLAEVELLVCLKTTENPEAGGGSKVPRKQEREAKAF